MNQLCLCLYKDDDFRKNLESFYKVNVVREIEFNIVKEKE
jgi:hypothetical protein